MLHAVGDAFLAALDDPARAALHERAYPRSWQARSTLFREGDPADRVMIIESGVVKAVAATDNGVDAVLALRGPGDILGELTAVNGGVRTATVVAVEPVRALVVPVDSFRQYLLDHPTAALALLGVVGDRLADSSRRQAEFGSLDATARLARLLLELAEVYGSATDGVTTLRLLSQDELASFCGASREAIARGLRTLRDEGLVETGRRSVTIVDIERLAAFAAP